MQFNPQDNGADVKVTTRIEPPPPPPQPVRTFVIELTQEEADYLKTLLVYFDTTTRGLFVDTPEYGPRVKLQQRIGPLGRALGDVDAQFIFGL